MQQNSAYPQKILSNTRHPLALFYPVIPQGALRVTLFRDLIFQCAALLPYSVMLRGFSPVSIPAQSAVK